MNPARPSRLSACNAQAGNQRFYPQINADVRRWYDPVFYLRLSAQICGYKAVEEKCCQKNQFSADSSANGLTTKNTRKHKKGIDHE